MCVYGVLGILLGCVYCLLVRGIGHRHATIPTYPPACLLRASQNSIMTNIGE